MRGSPAPDRASSALEPVDFSQVPHWADDDHAAAFAAFAEHRKKPGGVSYKQPLTGCDPDELLRLAQIAQHVDLKEARSFFETHFVPLRIRPGGRMLEEPQILTGFFEPELSASRTRTNQFTVPVFAPPGQLVDVREIADGSLPAGYRFGWRSANGVIGQAPDRAEITSGALDDVAPIIAWLNDPVDAFFMHVQGAARLNLSDGRAMRVTYAAKSGHPFTPIGKLLVEDGHISPSDVSMQSIAAWLRANPDDATQVMNQNRSYIFFKESPLGDAHLGPIAAAKIQLTPGRSLAVDMRYHTFATPIYVHASNVNGYDDCRLMIAQETGTAIRGPVRGDMFFGTGERAGQLAGGVVSPAEFYLLCPKAQASDLAEKWMAA
ncbi:MAG: MltA domain-containing protein [Pseudomonadota bacterium]